MKPIATLAVILTCGPTWAQLPTVELVAHETVVYLGQPLIVTGNVRNASPDPITLVYHNAPTFAQSQSSVIALYFGSDKANLKEWTDSLRPVGRMLPKKLAPGEVASVDFVMLFNSRDEFYARESGKYLLAGKVSNSKMGNVFSPPVEIEIREPSKTIDRLNWQWINDNKEEYGRMMQIPWEAKLSDEFQREAGRRCEAADSVYSEYLALFLSRAYREGPKKDADLSAHFAQIAKVRASSEKIRKEAEKLFSPAVPSAIAQSDVDPETRIAVAEVVEGFGSALTSGRMKDCADMLSEDFLFKGALDKNRGLVALEADLKSIDGGVASIRIDSYLRGPVADEVEVSGRYMIVAIGRKPSVQAVRWILRREDGANWVIHRWDSVSPPATPTNESQTGP